MLRAVLLALISLGTGLIHAADSRFEEIRERGELIFAVYENFPPFSFQEAGRDRGIDVEIARELAARLGVAAIIRQVGADESVEDDLRNNVWKGHYMGGGVADVMLHVPFNRDFQRRNDQVRLFGAYYREQIVVTLASGHDPRADPLDLFARERVGVELDTLADFYLLSAAGGRIRDNVVHFKNMTDAVAALLAREVAGVVGPRSEIEGAAGTRLGELSVVPSPLPGLFQNGWDLGLAVKQAHNTLADRLQIAVSELYAEGRLAEIFNAHGVTYQPPNQTSF